MKSILITGISGFVGGHISEYYFKRSAGECTLFGISRSAPSWDFVKEKETLLKSISFYSCDLLDFSKVYKIIEDIQPDSIIHLASLSSVADSWKNPIASFQNNTNAFLNIVESVRQQNLKTKILSIGSSEEYGIVRNEDLPLSEDRPVIPENPYAVARVSEEYLSRVYSKGYGIEISCTRSFNHIGPGQTEKFVVSSIAKQFAEIALNSKKSVIKIGDGSIIRDFIDIEDVIRAYDAILSKGVPGDVYNVCTGKGYSILDIIQHLSTLTGVKVKIEQDQNLMRPVDNPRIIGNYEKLHRTTGWSPLYSFDDSLQKIYGYWYNKIK